MLRGPDLTGIPVVPVSPTPTKSVATTPVVERAASSDDFQGTPETVAVRSGDTLGSIAARYHLSLAELKELNPEFFTEGRDDRGRKRAANGHWIYPGDQVRIRPEGSQAGASTSTAALAARVKAARLQADQSAAPVMPAAQEAVAPEAKPAKAATEATAPEAEPTKAATEATAPAAEPTKAATESAPAVAEQAAPAATPTVPEPVTPAPKPAAAEAIAPPAPVTPAPVAPAPVAPAAVAPAAEAAPKAPPPPAKPAKHAHVYAVERYSPRPIPASPPPVPTTMAAGQGLNKKEQLIIGGLLAGLSLVKMPDSMEKNIGDSAVDEVLTKTPLYTRNPEIVRYVAAVGEKLVNQSDRTDLDWRFYVVDSNQINAFALPGGHVFITTGALRNIKNESELAGVLGHEISHVEKRHSVKQLQKSLLAQGVAIAALGDKGAGTQVAAQLAIGIAMNGYSRSSEQEADERGTELAAQAGYDPKGLLGFFETLKQAHPDSSEWMAWTSDHPQTGDRIEDVTKHIKEKGLTGPSESKPDIYRQVMSRL